MDEQAKSRPVKASLKMVADRAQVSPATVSRILNGTAKVSSEKRQRIEHAISELGFRPNMAARSLAGGRSMSIGVITQFISSPFYAEALRGLEDELAKHNYIPIFMSSHWDSAQEETQIARLIERNVDGIVLLSSQLSGQKLFEFSNELPIVVTGRHFESIQASSVNWDNTYSGVLVADHLLELGHREIAVIVGAEGHEDSHERMLGIQTRLKESGVLLNADRIQMGGYTERGGYEAAKSLIASGEPFTGLIALNDQMAIGANLALREAGINVPSQVSLVGCDDIQFAEFVDPPLTTVHQPIYELGEQAAKHVLSLVNKVRLPRESIKLPHMVVRGSTAPCQVTVPS
jgi:LacI family transcriptional regulator